MGRIKSVKENPTGRNTLFEIDGKIKTRAVLVNEIKQGKYDKYHIRNINGVDTPVSNPDKSENNNIE